MCAGSAVPAELLLDKLVPTHRLTSSEALEQKQPLLLLNLPQPLPVLTLAGSRNASADLGGAAEPGAGQGHILVPTLWQRQGSDCKPPQPTSHRTLARSLAHACPSD